MALEIIDKKIVGTIDNLEDKLNGEIPVTREELLLLVDSWGRSTGFYTKDSQNKDMYIEECKAKECYDLSKLDVSEITNMEDLFLDSNFNVDIHSMNGIGLDNGDISNWNVSNVTNMSFMFHRSYNFNCDIENWDTSKVTDMNSMFSYAYNFNQNIGNWDTSRVTNMKRLFNGATIFNQDIGKWDVSKVTNMYGMFYEAENFNQDISKWDVSNVKDMSSMFFEAKSFNQNISSWNLDNIKNSYFMFNKAKAFLDKYNNGNFLPNYTEGIKEWFNINREIMNIINVKDKHGDEIDSFFSNITDIYSTNRIELHKDI